MKLHIAYIIVLFSLASTRASQWESMPDQCYCSDKCGPRDVKPDDSPFIDPETGICFCQQRDKDNYLANRCNIKNPQTKFNNSYCNKKN